jgi:predicted house-cleaning noncanonical NTP pyrophosphatase (MazG superfamily)
MYVDQKKEIVTVALRSKPPVLRSESADEYTSLHKKLVEEIGPQGPIEAVYVEEITDLIWEIKRLRNCKVSVIHQMSRRALEGLLTELLTIQQKIKAQPLAKRWFEDAAAREEVSEILKRFNLDESAIEAEAIKLASDQLGQRFHGLNHIRLPRRACMTKCE